MNPKILLLVIGGMLVGMILLALVASSQPKEEVFADLPQEGKNALENYIARYGVEAITFDESESDGGSFLAQTAKNGSNWREDVQEAWCVFTLSQFRLSSGQESHEFLVYLTNENEWEVVSNEKLFTDAGCQ